MPELRHLPPALSLRPILVIGRGQLAQALLQRGSHFALAALGRSELNFDRPEAIEPALARYASFAIVNAAAYTRVDAAEADPASASRANRDGPAAIARFCAERAIPFVHVSTDYVFDGTKGAPYVESDRPAPLNVYGASKLAGERAVLEANPRALVLRTAWLISPFGRNFVRTILAERFRPEPLRVVADQRGSPTAAGDLAEIIFRLLERIAGTAWQRAYGGLFHAAGAGDASWFELALAVADEARRRGVALPPIVPIATRDRPAAARRPADSRLDCGKLSRVFGLSFPNWRRSLGPIVDELLAPAAD